MLLSWPSKELAAILNVAAEPGNTGRIELF